MSNKNINIIVVVFVLTAAQLCWGLEDNRSQGNEESALKVHLPREVTIEGAAISLGEVGIICGQESLVDKASEILLGSISRPGQEVVIDRQIVLSRLACNGISPSKVALTGAKEVAVKQQHMLFEGVEFVALASEFLEKNLSRISACRWSAVRTPKDLTLAGGGNIEFLPHLVKSNATDLARVEIGVLENGRQIDEREVVFRLQYECHNVVAQADIPKGAVIDSNNVRIEKGFSSVPEPVGWKPPYGLVARRPIEANTVIRAGMLAVLQPEVIIERNQAVVIQIQRPGLRVTAVGSAMEKGREGELIKVRNVDSQRIVVARVNEDGTVEPVY